MMLLTLLLGVGYAQDASEVYVTSDTLQVYFRQDKIVLDPLFRDNGARLAEFSHRFDSLLEAPQSKVRSVLIISGASPEGPSTRNRWLSDNRAKVVYDYLTENHYIDPDKIEIASRGVDWKGLTQRVAASNLPYRDEVLEILAFPEWVTKNGKVVDGRKHRLMNFRGGRVWNELYDLYYADLRGTRVMIVWNIPRPDVTSVLPIGTGDNDCIDDTIYIDRTDTLYVGDPVVPDTTESLRTGRRWRLAVKTNMPYDLALVPNIGVEAMLGDRWSVAAYWMYSWWHDDTWHWYWRTYGGDIAVRRWWGGDPERNLTGHHIGLYGQIVTYDFELGGRGYLGDRWTYAGGVEYGYGCRIGRRLNLDFTLGVGYMEGIYKEYLPIDGCYVWQATKRRRWMGPTKVEVSLVWLLGDTRRYGKEVDR